MRKLTMPELNRLSVEEFKAAEKIPVIVVLDNIRSQNNIGVFSARRMPSGCRGFIFAGSPPPLPTAKSIKQRWAQPNRSTGSISRKQRPP